MKKNDTLETPQFIIDELGPFDLDPCAGENTTCASENWSIQSGKDGLLLKWKGFVFCNPPFSEKEFWIEKMIQHGNGIILLPERGSAPWFGPLAQSCKQYFVMGQKINFIGGPSSNNIGSVLFLFGEEAKNRILLSNLPGHLVEVKFFNPRATKN